MNSLSRAPRSWPLVVFTTTVSEAAACPCPDVAEKAAAPARDDARVKKARLPTRKSFPILPFLFYLRCRDWRPVEFVPWCGYSPDRCIRSIAVETILLSAHPGFRREPIT